MTNYCNATGICDFPLSFVSVLLHARIEFYDGMQQKFNVWIGCWHMCVLNRAILMIRLILSENICSVTRA